MVIKRTAEQTRANGVPQHATLFCRVLKVSFVGSEFHGLTATVEFKRPCASVDVCFELELASQPRPDGTDAFRRFVSLALGVDKHGLKTTDGDGGFIHHVHDHLNDVLVVVVNFHLDRCQVGVQGTCTGTVVITHLGSPIWTDGWHYFNGLPFRVAINAIANASLQAGTSPQRRPCGACGQRPCGIQHRLNRR